MSPDLMAIWFTTLLGPSTANELTLPYAGTPQTLDALISVFKHRFAVGPLCEDMVFGHNGDVVAVLVQDELDHLWADALFDDDVVRLCVMHDRFRFGAYSSSCPIITNAGLFGRHVDANSCVGEIATCIAMAPLYGVGHVVAFACRNESGTADIGALAAASHVAGVTLSAPFKDLGSTEALGLLLSLGYPTLPVFRAAQKRYGLRPETRAGSIWEVFSELEELATSVPSVALGSNIYARLERSHTARRPREEVKDIAMETLSKAPLPAAPKNVAMASLRHLWCRGAAGKRAFPLKLPAWLFR